LPQLNIFSYINQRLVDIGYNVHYQIIWLSQESVGIILPFLPEMFYTD